MQNLPWIVSLVCLALLAVGLGVWGWIGSSPKRSPALPSEWALVARPVFSTNERRVHRILRDAFPQHVVLSKLPLVRFCQPTDPNEVRYWYDLIGSSHVSFAVCSGNGRVLAAIDLDSERSESRRRMQIKQAVLSACRVRYLRCAADHLPSVTELQLLVPGTGQVPHAPQPTPSASRHRGGTRAAAARIEHKALWQDSAVLQDSFFTPDARVDSFGDSPFSAFPEPLRRAAATASSVPRSAGRDADRSADVAEFHYPDFDFERWLEDEDHFGDRIDPSSRFDSTSRSESSC